MSTASATEAPRAVDAGDPMLPRLARVRARRREAPEVWTLTIDPEPEGAFQPGQFNMLGLPGVGEVPISMSGDPVERGKLVHTIRAVGPVSSALAKLGPGAAMAVRGPFGIGWPMAQAAGRDVLVLAGGLGMAPLRPALCRLLGERTAYRKIALLYGTRSPEDVLFRRDLEAWRRRLDIAIEITVDHAFGDWHGHVGVVTTLVPRADFDPGNTVALVCGPEVMMRFAVAALLHAGVSADAIWLSMERNMQCAIGLCGHCQFGPHFVCRDGPVFRYDRVSRFLGVKEL